MRHRGRSIKGQMLFDSCELQAMSHLKLLVLSILDQADISRSSRFSSTCPSGVRGPRGCGHSRADLGLLYTYCVAWSTSRRVPSGISVSASTHSSRLLVAGAVDTLRAWLVSD